MAAHDQAHHSDGVAGRRLVAALLLALATAALEFTGGFVSGSLALLADATHVLGDVGALSLALAAIWFASRPHSLRFTFGYHRAEVIAATANALALLLIAALVAWRAVERLRAPAEVDATVLTVVASVGLVANIGLLLILSGPQSLNVRAARLHVLSDLGGSVAAVSAGVLMALTGNTSIDAVLSLLIAALVAFGAAMLLRETVAIVMARVPPGVDLPEISTALRALDGVVAVHDEHCWTITTGFVAFAAHIELAPGVDAVAVVAEARALLRDRFEIEHVTIQPEAAVIHDLGGTPA